MGRVGGGAGFAGAGSPRDVDERIAETARDGSGEAATLPEAEKNGAVFVGDAGATGTPEAGEDLGGGGGETVMRGRVPVVRSGESGTPDEVAGG